MASAGRVGLSRAFRGLLEAAAVAQPARAGPLHVPARIVSTSFADAGRYTGFMTNVPFRKGQTKDLIYRLSAEERVALLRELQALQAHAQRTPEGGARVVPPSTAQLRAVALFNAMPFIGFGFLDNLIMILAGDYIDMTIGATLGISTMAAAGLGNMISDIAGVGSAWYVESFVAKLGVTAPPLSPEQFEMVSTRWSAHFGRAIGVSIGCLLGMLPLLFLRKKPKKNKEEDATQSKK